MNNYNTKNLELDDGACIAVVGGGPAGSFYAYFALDHAERFGLDISIDIIEAKDFNKCGPAGCNNCGGIVSEYLIQMLSAEGIVLPKEVVRKGIGTYTLHLEQGSTVIEAPVNEQRIASMYRGLGPKGCKPNGQKSFDDHLLELCKSKGANIINDRVTDMDHTLDGVIVRTKNQFEKKYDLVVGAVGLNQKTFSLFKKICPSFVSPKVTRTYICELQLERDVIDEYFGNSMHVFLLDMPNIKFGALIPKSNYVTLVLLGNNIDKDIATGFLNSPAVKKCFPPDADLDKMKACNCFPYINVGMAKSAYNDRVLLIGDSATSKLYKNGIGAAYITAKAAANTTIFEGISKKHFKKYFMPTCRRLERDNSVGKFIFMITTIIQKTYFIKRAMLQLVIKEQKRNRPQRKLSSILWDTFTGSAPYTDIFIRFLNYKVLIPLFGLSIKSIFNNKQYEI